MAQLTKSNIGQSPQNKPGEASLTETDIRLAGQIGRQLAVIGDEINQHYHETFQSIRLHRTHTATRVYGSSSIIAQRRPFFFHKGIKAMFGTIKRYLMNSVQYPIIQRSRVWVAHVCPSNVYIKWTAGFLAVFLLGVAIGIDF